MDKSFGYDPSRHQFRIARHQVGDFGLHLSLIRSFSWGNNLPPESPFFPGKSLPYHYYFDLAVGLLERVGVRIDLALNGLSILFFTALLFLIYKLSQLIFGKNLFRGIVSVLLFIFSSSLTFLDFLKDKSLSPTLWRNLWLLPDYLHKGPFDGSLISIYFTLNVFLNQRHLIAGLVISLTVFYIVLERLLHNKDLNIGSLIMLSAILGFSSRVHSLVFASSLIVLLALLFLFARLRWIVPMFLPALFLASFHFREALDQGSSFMLQLGFLTPPPVTLVNFLNYWWVNLGLAILLIPLGLIYASTNQKKIFLSFFLLFVIANSFRLSYRIEHNHSLINFFFIIANFYTAYFLGTIWQKGWAGKIIFSGLFLVLTASGLVNFMAIKNDFQYPVNDAPASEFMQWIKDSTDKRAVFLARQEIFDPVTLAGRKNYFGATYYLSVMGYNFSERETLAASFFEADSSSELEAIKQAGINYLVIPTKAIVNFAYRVNKDFLEENLSVVYSDNEVRVYKL